MQATISAQERVRLIEIQGIQVVDLDFTQAGAQQTLGMLDEFQRLLQGAKQGSLRVLSNVTDMAYDAGVSSKWKAIRMEYAPAVKASAVYGASSFLSVAVRSYSDLMAWLKLPHAKDQIRVFKTRDQALAWLLKT